MTYNDDTKAVVMAALLQGQSVNSVAKQYKIPRTTVIGWKKAAGLDNPTVSDTKKDELGELLVSYLSAAIVTLREQVECFRDKAWLKSQPASEVAVLHGVLADKVIRLLEAGEEARRQANSAAQEGDAARDTAEDQE